MCVYLCYIWVCGYKGIHLHTYKKGSACVYNSNYNQRENGFLLEGSQQSLIVKKKNCRFLTSSMDEAMHNFRLALGI